MTHSVAVRLATLDDAHTLWLWRNDPTTRAMSRHHGTVPLADHRAWLSASLGAPDRHLLIGSRAGVDVGTVRWDQTGVGQWEVSLTVAPQMRGQHLAGELLLAGELWLTGATVVGQRVAVIHTDNAPSLALFDGAGYAPDGAPDAQGYQRWTRGEPLTDDELAGAFEWWDAHQ